MSSLPWFKLYNEARVDRKLAHLTLAERGVWVNLLCYASEQEHETRGTFDASDHYLLAMECAEGDEAILNSTLEKLQRSKHLITIEDKDGWLAFRTYENRQARKPSDEPEATRERQRRSRASRRSNTVSRDVTRDSHEKRNVTRLDIREESREIRDDPPFSLSGEDVYTPADAVNGEHSVTSAREAAAAAAPNISNWDEARWRRTAQEVASTIRLHPKNIPRLLKTFKARNLSPEVIEDQAGGYAEWLEKNHKTAEVRVFATWLDRYQTQQDVLREQQQGKVATNGHQHTATDGPGSNGTNGHHADERPKPDWEQRYEYLLAQKRGEAS